MIRHLRQVTQVLLVMSLLVPAAGAASSCCAPSHEITPHVSASCCCQATCMLQADPCGVDPFRLTVDFAPGRSMARVNPLTEVASASSSMFRVALTRAAGPPAECALPADRSCHAVSLPLRL